MRDLEGQGEVRDGLRYPWPQPPASGQAREVASGVWWLRMPLPFRLDHINLYLLRHKAGWVVVDTGMNTPETRETWMRVLTEVCGGQPLLAVICTHFHSDHAGLAAWLGEQFRCPLYMTAGEFQWLHVRPPCGQPAWTFVDFYRKAGFSLKRIDALFAAIQNSHFRPLACTAFRRLRHGSHLRIGARDWTVHVGSGHSPEHACLYSAQDSLLIAGDQVLPRITSTVGVQPTEPEADPLRDWLASIERLRAVPDSVLVLPAHERPFFNLHRRLDQLHAHHQDHLARMLAHCAEPRCALDLMALLFPRVSGSFDELMALSETLAHANYLMAEGALVREERGGLLWYRQAPPGALAPDPHVVF